MVLIGLIPNHQLNWWLVTYFGYIIPIEKDVFGVFTDTGEEIVLVKIVSNDIIILQLYMNGQYVEEYWLEEHYES